MGTDCPPNLSRETSEECDLDPRPPLQREKDEDIGQLMLFRPNWSICTHTRISMADYCVLFCIFQKQTKKKVGLCFYRIPSAKDNP